MDQNMTQLRERLGGLPAEGERGYEVTLTSMVNRSEVCEADLKEILRAFRENRGAYPEGRREQEEKIAYAAFFCLNILYRHSLDIVKFRDILQENACWCRGHSTFRYLTIMQNMHIPEELEGREDEFLSDLYDFAQAHRNNAGYVHAFANLYAVVCEKNYDRQEYFRQKWEKKAMKEVGRAISLDPNYALYYSTKGRIAMIGGDFAAAEELFEKAMHKEDSSRRDGYGIRISQYQSYKSQARAMLVSARIQEQIDALKAANISNIEILGFFASVIAFVLGSLSLAKDQTAVHAAGLIIVLMGALLLVYAAFCFLLRLNTRRDKKIYLANLAAALLGAAVAVGGLLLCFTQ